MSRTQATSSEILAGERFALAGKLASMSRRDASQLIRRHGGIVVDQPDPTTDTLVVGEAELPLPEGWETEELLDEATRRAVDAGTLRVISETQLWQRLGLVETEREIRRLYTPSMLAELVGVPVAVIRRWHRRGLIVPVREVRRLPYFDFQEVATARRLAEMLAAGISPAAIEKKLAALARYLPQVERPLAQLSVIIEGKEILLRQGDGLIEPGGQLRFDFEAAERDEAAESVDLATAEETAAEEQLTADQLAGSPREICRVAAELEDAGQLETAAEMYRAALAMGGPNAEICFQVAELLYRMGDLTGARERYYMTVELDQDYVEARANLGCVLAEQGQGELAVAAFQGALTYHGEYADVHYHLARTLDQLGRPLEAVEHWRAFLQLAPNSPWADQARSRLEEEADTPG